MTEVDRARQRVQEITKDHERQVKELRGEWAQVQCTRDHLRQELLDARAELKTASAVRAHLEERLRAPVRPVASRTGGGKAQRARKRTRSGK
jgi:negative regulator of sigma E activity